MNKIDENTAEVLLSYYKIFLSKGYISLNSNHLLTSKEELYYIHRYIVGEPIKNLADKYDRSVSNVSSWCRKAMIKLNAFAASVDVMYDRYKRELISCSDIPKYMIYHLNKMGCYTMTHLWDIVTKTSMLPYTDAFMLYYKCKDFFNDSYNRKCVSLLSEDEYDLVHLLASDTLDIARENECTLDKCNNPVICIHHNKYSGDFINDIIRVHKSIDGYCADDYHYLYRFATLEDKGDICISKPEK